MAGAIYWRNNDLSSSAVDVEGQMARFVAKTLTVISCAEPRDGGCSGCCYWRGEL